MATTTQAPDIIDSAAPFSKRQKLSTTFSPHFPSGLSQCLTLLSTTPSSPTPHVPETLTSSVKKIENDLNKLRQLFDKHEFRTSVVSSPRPALSIYKDSCNLDPPPKSAMANGTMNQCDDDVKLTMKEESLAMSLTLQGKEFLLSMLGMHPLQSEIERWYSTSIKPIYCLARFCHRVKVACPDACKDDMVAQILEKFEGLCRDVSCTTSPVEKAQSFSSTVSEMVAELMTTVVKADRRIRIEQLRREYERIQILNSTFANSRLQLFVDEHDCVIKDFYFKRSHAAKYERITVYMYDPEIDYYKPPRFTFLPLLRKALDDGPEAVAKEMVQSFWSHLLRHGYFATEKIKAEINPNLEKFLLSGICQDVTLPMRLNAHFEPTYPISVYVHGKAGAGKSSFVRNFSPALEATIEENVDPEILVRFVKQNLNKPYKNLELEFELRPNNNDLSVMSIIQGRRMTLTQSKPGLVVVDLEEMASNREEADPNQLKIAQLISQRFSGRNSAFNEKETKAPRNSEKRGICNDATLVTLFTSNYELEPPCSAAFKRLKMFENLKSIHMVAVDKDDRVDFAKTYITQCIHDQFTDINPTCEIDLNIPVGSGDTRPLVRELRMLSFYVCALAKEGVKVGSTINARIDHDASSRITTVKLDEKSIQLKIGSFDNFYPLTPRVFDPRAENAIRQLRSIPSLKDNNLAELSQILDYYFAKTLAPAVILSQDADLIQNIITAVASQKDVHCIKDVDASSYKMMKSLYDPNDTPNLRDDILRFGKGAYVTIQIRCDDTDAQLCIREIIEDSPSMTAFSTNKSALYKSGLFFGVYVDGTITPEVRSRASLVL